MINHLSKQVWILYSIVLILSLLSVAGHAQHHSVARRWNEALLQAIRYDYARPTVHARNLFHVSAAMYDAWAMHDSQASTYLLGNQVGEYQSRFKGLGETYHGDVNEVISYAAYRLLTHRFYNSPNQMRTQQIFDELMDELGYDKTYPSVNYEPSTPAELGQLIAGEYIEFGYQDGSNELGAYQNEYYLPVNDPMILSFGGFIDLTDPNRWQPLAFNVFIDQSGEESGNIPEFLSPEWGNVLPFSLGQNDMSEYSRDGEGYKVYMDPGMPPMIDSEAYKRGFAMVSVWSSHLDANDPTMIDISPAGIGNISSFPQSVDEYEDFYQFFDGGDGSTGHLINPITNAPYEPQMAKRADYARVLAEFWADGPDSETPPGHWFTILNYVNDHPMLEKRIEGAGDIVDDLEWDVKSYFLLGGTMHDAAISAWSIKGWYDYVRPISAIRYMATMGQSTNDQLDNYHPNGIPLIDNYIEIIEEGDPLAGDRSQFVGEIKVFAWKGHDEIQDPSIAEAGVGWILATDWWPYQRPTFVTPPFAGYVSGHSTYSRAAAEVLTAWTGSEYFPGGMGEFLAMQNRFLVFEDGPSEDITLQWATYRDASDQCSLSRIWGGIHPPADDIPGRIIGERIGGKAFDKAMQYFQGQSSPAGNTDFDNSEVITYPNPTNGEFTISLPFAVENPSVKITTLTGQSVPAWTRLSALNEIHIRIKERQPQQLFITILDGDNVLVHQKVILTY